jgi:hypothetical protein
MPVATTVTGAKGRCHRRRPFAEPRRYARSHHRDAPVGLAARSRELRMPVLTLQIAPFSTWRRCPRTFTSSAAGQRGKVLTSNA